MLKLYNKEHKAIGVLTNLKDYKIEYVLSGEDLLELSLSICDENIHLVEEEGYVRNKNNEYVIKAIDPGDNFKRFTCNVNIEDIVGKAIANFDTSNNKLDDTIRLAIAGTGWILVDSGITKRRTVRLTNTNALEVLREVRKVFSVDFRYDAINKKIYVYEEFGEDKGVYFSDELNLKSLSIPSDTYDYVTRLYPYGKDGLNISSVNNGKEYIENFQYSNKIIELIWQDNRYTDVNSLKEDAEAKLEELSKPKRSYQTSVTDLAKQSEEYSYLDFFLGDTVTLLSKSEKFRDKQRIVKYIEYPNNPNENTCELGNTILTFEELQQENEYKNQTVDNITTGNGTVNGEAIDGISTEQIYDFEASVGKITDLTAINIKVSNLEAQNVTITGKLNAIEGEFGTLKANVGVIDKLTVTHTAQINDLKANSATITQLEAVSAKIGTVEAEVGKIQTLVNGNLTSDNIHSLILTSSKVTVENGFIKNAMIENVDVSKVNAGDISTNKFRIVSDSGKMLIADNTIQIKDNNRVRVQIGKDASNDYSMYVWDSSGKLMFDATGLKADGIKNKIIRDDMISDNANIDGGKLNISSVVTSINNGTTTIKGSKIYLDEKSQTLNVAFNAMSNTVNDHTSTIGSHTTSIGVMQGQISGLISDTTIVEDGTSKKIKDVYTSLKATVNGISSKVSSVESSFNNMQIGGRNLLLKSATNDLTAMSNHVGSNCTSTATIVADTSSPSGKAIKIVKTNTTGAPNGGRYFKIRERLVAGETYSWSIYVKGTGSVGSMGPEQGGYRTNIKLTSEYKKITHTFVATEKPNYQFVFYGGSDFDLTFHSIKLEIGNKATDWTPAPEDVESSINSVDTKVTALDVTVKSTNSKVSAIEQSMESITQRVSSTETKVTTITNTANTANSNATNALNTANSANSKIDGLQIGGKNLIIRHNELKDKMIDTNGAVGTLATSSLMLDFIKVIPGESLLFSQIENAGGDNYFRYAFYAENKTTVIKRTPNNALKFKEIVPSGAYWLRVSYDSNNQVKLEKGTKYTDWTPAPEDVQDQINANKTEISSTKSKVSTIETNLSGITQRVSTVEQKQTTVDGKVTALETWKKSAEQKITDASIISTVSSQFYKKGETDSKYATKSLVTQTANDVRYEFQQYGSHPNLMINGCPKYNNYKHSGWYTQDSWVDSSTNTFRFATYTDGGYNEGFLYSPPINVTPNTTYSLSYWLEIEDNVHSHDCFIWEIDKNGTWLYTQHIVTSTDHWWRKYNKTFTTGPNTYKVIVRFDHNGYIVNNGSKIWCYLDYVMLCKGSEIYPINWYPCAEEVIGDTSIINGNGVVVTHSNGSYTQMSSRGLEHWENGMARPYHYMFDCIIVDCNGKCNGTWFKVQLPSIWKGKDFTVAWQAGNYSAPYGRVVAGVEVNCRNKNITNATVEVQMTVYTKGEWSGSSLADVNTYGWCKLFLMY